LEEKRKNLIWEWRGIKENAIKKKNRVFGLGFKENVVLIVCRKIDKNRETYIRVLLRSWTPTPGLRSESSLINSRFIMYNGAINSLKYP